MDFGEGVWVANQKQVGVINVKYLTQFPLLVYEYLSDKSWLSNVSRLRAISVYCWFVVFIHTNNRLKHIYRSAHLFHNGHCRSALRLFMNVFVVVTDKGCWVMLHKVIVYIARN